MSFDYDKIKDKQNSGTHWATYSDLFMVLSLIFLLLYVVASLRTGTSNLQSEAKYQEIERQRDDLRQQIRVYNTLKDNYLQTGATSEERKLYEDLMSQLVLLKGEAGQEKEELRKAAIENEKKEMALNKYQQLVRNIVNANIVSSARIKRRDMAIKKSDKEIRDLESEVLKKQREITQGQKKIKTLNRELDRQVALVRQSYKKNKISKKRMKQRIAGLRKKNQLEIEKLKTANVRAAEEIEENRKVIVRASRDLKLAQSRIVLQEADIKKLVDEKQKVTWEIARLRDDFNRKSQEEKKNFEKQLTAQKLSANAKAKKQVRFFKKLRKKEQKLAGRIQDMESRIQNVQEQLDKTEREKVKLAEKNRELVVDKQQLSEDVKRMERVADAKRKLIKKIRKNLKKAGLRANVDEKGDVVIQFGDEYFDTGQASIKPGMQQILRKFVPSYASSLFSDSGIASQIKSVEIIGYASPTYKGRYVNPVSLKAGNKEAVNYNLDLSYYRARSIFDFIFDTKKMKYPNQEKLLPMVKVTGRSFLAEGADKRVVSSMSHGEYCKKYDCKKSQRVVIRFNMNK